MFRGREIDCPLMVKVRSCPRAMGFGLSEVHAPSTTLRNLDGCFPHLTGGAPGHPVRRLVGSPAATDVNWSTAWAFCLPSRDRSSHLRVSNRGAACLGAWQSAEGLRIKLLITTSTISTGMDSTGHSNSLLCELYQFVGMPPEGVLPYNFDPASPDLEALLFHLLPELFSPPASPNFEYLYSPETPPDRRSTQGTAPNFPHFPHDAANPSSLLPQTAAPAVDDGTRLYIIYSASTSLPPPMPPPQNATRLPPPNWHTIPQRHYGRGRRQWDFTPFGCVFFEVDGCPGMNMGEAFRQRFPDLKGRDEIVLQGARSAISCRFMFPGYPPNSSPQISTTNWNEERDPIKRSTLAHRIAKKLNQYLDSMRSQTMDQFTPEQWKIGEGFMHLDNMFLVRLESVSNGSWQPEICVVDPTV